jgi:hypothetical protein
MARYSGWRALAIAGLVLGAAAACERVATDPGAGPSANAAAATGAIGGTVRSLDGNPVAGAVVSTPGGQSAVTGANGSFTLGGLAAADRLPVDVSAPGFAGTVRIYRVVPGAELSREIRLVPEGAPVAIRAGQGGEVRFSDGGLIEIPANAFAGVSPEENVIVRVSYYDPADAAAFRQAPGDFSGIEADGSASVLSSNGMWSVSVTNARGVALRSVDGRQMRASLPNRQDRLVGGGGGTPEEPSEWAVYKLVNGRWVFVTSTTESAQRTYFEAGVKYNIDRQTSSSAMVVRAFDSLGNPLSNFSVTASAASYFGGAEAWTDANGFATLQLGSGQQVNLLGGAGAVLVTTPPTGGTSPVTSLVF